MMVMMKRLIGGHRTVCDMSGVAVGAALGFLAANVLVDRCSCSCELKRKAKKAFRQIEDKITL